MSRNGGAGPILCVVGARPNFMKIAPILRALRGAIPPLPARMVHTGQHYDAEMNRHFFEALGIPDPDINLEVGSGTHAVQTAEVMRRFEPVVDRERPARVGEHFEDPDAATQRLRRRRRSAGRRGHVRSQSCRCAAGRIRSVQ